MSVIRAHRRESKVLYINNAIDIEINTIELLTKLSSKYQRIFADKTSNLALDIANNCEMANSYYPNSQEHIDKRKELLEDAKSKVKALDIQLALIYDVLLNNPQGAFHSPDEKPVTASVAKQKLEAIASKLGENIDSEITLIDKVLESDKKRLGV